MSASIKEQLAALKQRRSELMAEREALVATYQDQLTALEQQRKELAEQCPHDNMLFGIYNQCADCEEWF